jgi:hypothetical protein
VTPAERRVVERAEVEVEAIATVLRSLPGGFAPPLTGLVDRIRALAADLSDLTATKETDARVGS